MEEKNKRIITIDNVLKENVRNKNKTTGHKNHLYFFL